MFSGVWMGRKFYIFSNFCQIEKLRELHDIGRVATFWNWRQKRGEKGDIINRCANAKSCTQLKLYLQYLFTSNDISREWHIKMFIIILLDVALLLAIIIIIVITILPRFHSNHLQTDEFHSPFSTRSTTSDFYSSFIIFCNLNDFQCRSHFVLCRKTVNSY